MVLCLTSWVTQYLPGSMMCVLLTQGMTPDVTCNPAHLKVWQYLNVVLRLASLQQPFTCISYCAMDKETAYTLFFAEKLLTDFK